MYRLAVFVSGRGSNLLSIASQINQGKLKAEISAVVSNNNDCKAIEYAKTERIPHYVVANLKNETASVSYDELIKILKESEIDLIVLAGYLKKVPDSLIKEFKNRIINIHPALLPSFGGKGMYGINVHKAVFNSSAKISGPTVHFVNEIYDEGKIIAQKAVDISDVNSPEEISERVLKAEHELLPSVIKMFIDNKIRIEESRVFIH